MIVTNSNEITNFDIGEYISSINVKKEDVILFGASNAGEMAKQKLSEKGVQIKYFCDNDKAKWGKDISGIAVISPEELYGKSKDIFVLISSMYSRDIKEQLEKQGFKNIIDIHRSIFGEKIRCINKSDIDVKIKNFGNFSGITFKKREPKLIVSLTSYPERMKDVKYAIFSILNQTLKPDEVILWLSYEEFPEGESGLNNEILNFKENGLIIKFCHNIKPYKKLVPTLKLYPDSIIVTADDDIYYESDWLEKLYTAYEKYPQYIHCHRAHMVTFDYMGNLLPYNSWQHNVSWNQTSPSFVNFFTGCGGVLYPPNSLHKDVLNEELFLKLCPTADDIWFWAMAVLQGTKTNAAQNNIQKLTSINPERDLKLIEENYLWKINGAQGGNDKQLKAVFEYYNLYDVLNV